MRLPQLPLLLLFLLLFAGLLLAPGVQAAPPVLSVLPSAGTTVAGAGAARFDFPPQTTSNDKPLLHTFQLRNNTPHLLIIERVAVSCDCVQVLINETRSLPVKLLPGQTVPVQVTLRLDRSVPGPVSKSAWIYLHGGSSDGLRLEIRGTVRDTPASAQAALMPARPLGL